MATPLPPDPDPYNLFVWVRAVGGLLAIGTFLGLLIAAVLIPEVTLSESNIRYLFVLIAALLGLDLIVDRILGRSAN